MRIVIAALLFFFFFHVKESKIIPSTPLMFKNTNKLEANDNDHYKTPKRYMSLHIMNPDRSHQWQWPNNIYHRVVYKKLKEKKKKKKKKKKEFRQLQGTGRKYVIINNHAVSYYAFLIMILSQTLWPNPNYPGPGFGKFTVCNWNQFWQAH